MNGVVIYDTQYGNTEKVAQIIAATLGAPAFKTSELDSYDFSGLDLMVVGSPTHGGQPTEGIQELLDTISYDELDGVDVAAFDTRMDRKKHGVFKQLLMNLMRFAATRIQTHLVAAGGNAVIMPEGFIVDGWEGPLRAHELERAAQWAESLLVRVQRTHPSGSHAVA